LPSRLITSAVAVTVALMRSMPLIASRAADIPVSPASRATVSASSADSRAFCRTSFTEALISVADDDVCSAEVERASVFSDTCRIDASV
jgi:hypothetical protein